MSIQIVEKESLTQKELNSLHPDYGLFDGVNWEVERYYKNFNTGEIFEFRLCMDESYDERMREINMVQKKKEMLKMFLG